MNLNTLIAELKKANQDYHQSDRTSLLSDEEFDSKLALLNEMRDNGDFPEVFARDDVNDLLEGVAGQGSKVETDNIVKHDRPMLSLKKAKTRDELVAFIDKVLEVDSTSTFTLQPKLDGFALSATFVEGKLTRLATRGDGTVGEDMTYLISAPNLTINGLSSTIDVEGVVEVRGEILMSHENFKAVNAARTVAGLETFANPRNGVVGSMRRAKKGLQTAVTVTFATYSVIVNGALAALTTVPEGFLTVADLMEVHVPSISCTNLSKSEILESVDLFGQHRNEFPYPTDGAVVKPTNEGRLDSLMGSSSHSPKSQIAFKYPPVIGRTTIRAFTVTVGKTGRLTPTAVFDPVLIDGSTVTHASCHNFDYVSAMNLKIGSVVEVSKRGDIIPQVSRVVVTPDDSTEIPVPSSCPVCDSALTGELKVLACSNVDCDSRSVFTLRTAVGRDYLDIDGMSVKLLDSLYDAGLVTTVADLYDLDVPTLSQVKVGVTTKGNEKLFGEVRSIKVIESIEKSKTHDTYRILASLNIEGLGKTTSKLVVKSFASMDDFRRATVDQLCALDGIGTGTAESIVNGLSSKSVLIDRLIDAGVTFVFDGGVQKMSTDSKVAGLCFAISGEVPAPFANRNEFVDWLEKNGATFHSSPRKDTDVMVGDATASTSKTKKAVALGVRFVSPDDFASEFC